MTTIKRKATLLLLCLLTITICRAQATKIKEYLSIPGPIVLGNITYNLVWTSHPNDAYYKQEYLPQGQNVEHFKNLVMVEVLTGNDMVKDLANRKINEFKKRKAYDAAVKYEMFEKNGDLILDFVLSANGTDGKTMAVAERNVYRYRPIKENGGGKRCVLLVTAVERAYGKDIPQFLAGLKTRRSELVNLLTAYKMPSVSIKK